MNVFVVPSWYPSTANPITGIFFREQAMAMAGEYPELKIGISIWGQNDERLLLWSKRPQSSIAKLSRKPKSATTKLKNNLVEYFTPAYTWSSKILDGNLEQIIQANALNLKKFESDFQKPDIIHAHAAFPAGHIAKKLSLIYKIPYIITEHMSPFPHKQFLNKKGRMQPRLREAYSNSFCNICVSESLQRKMISFGIERTIVVPNLVDEDFFIPCVSTKKNEPFTFFSLGRMVPQKGIDLLLTAFSQIDGKVTLRIGGSGALLNEYKKLSAYLGIESSVQWLGELDKAAVLYEFQNCDAFVLPSRHESMGLVFAEAMACGKPVIATICGGPEEFVTDDCGFLVNVENNKQLVEAMKKMIAQRDKFYDKVIRKHFEARFSKEVVCKQIHEVYLQTIDAYKRE